MRSLFVLTLFLASFSCWSSRSLDVLRPEDLTGLVPSFWMDHTGFETEAPSSALVEFSERPMIPLLPLYSKGGFGKHVYVGGVIEEQYLSSLSRWDREDLLRKIHLMRDSEGRRFNAYQYNGKVYAIRNDYQVALVNSTTVGLSLSFSFTQNKMVTLGDSEVYGISLDIGAPFRVNPEKGFNLVGNLQKMIDDWSIGMGQDETKEIIDQSVLIAPALVSYLLEKPTPLLTTDGVPLEALPTMKNTSEAEPVSEKIASGADQFSKELKSIKKSLAKNLKKEISWKDIVKNQVAAEKIVGRASTNRFIQRLCDRLALAYEVPVELWPRCRVSATLAPNAWAYPGGDIFISAGLLGILSDVDSVALVLGHEIGHVLGRHVSKQSTIRKAYSYAATVISTAVNLGMTGFSLGGGWGLLGNVSFLSWYPQAMISSLGGAYLVDKGSRIAAFAPIAGMMLQSRDHESQADRIGQEAAYASGANLEAMSKGWEEFVSFLNENFPRELGVVEKIMQDHPNAEKRLQNFEKRSTELTARLGPINQENSFEEKLNSNYKRIHESFKPYADAYGQVLREKLMKIQNAKSSAQKERKVQHFIHTLIGPQSRCVRHALGAD